MADGEQSVLFGIIAAVVCGEAHQLLMKLSSISITDYLLGQWQHVFSHGSVIVFNHQPDLVNVLDLSALVVRIVLRVSVLARLWRV